MTHPKNYPRRKISSIQRQRNERSKRANAKDHIIQSKEPLYSVILYFSTTFYFYNHPFFVQHIFSDYRMSRILLGGLRKPTQLFRLRQCSEYVGPFLVQTDKGVIYQPGMNIISYYNLYK